MAKPRMTQKAIREAVDMISTGLLILEQADDELKKWHGKEFVDAVARLNASYHTLERIVNPLRTYVKGMGTNTKPTEYIRGTFFKAVLRRFKKSYFDHVKAEKFLGKKKYLSCWVKRTEESLSFDIQG